MKIAVVGGGICGLSTAFFLKRAIPAAQITLFESDSTLGGKLKTTHKYGFAIEHSALGFKNSSKALKTLAFEAGADHLIEDYKEHIKPLYLFTKKRVAQKAPVNYKEFLETPLFGFFSKSLALLLQTVVGSASKRDESVYSYLKKRLGGKVGGEISDILSTVFGGSLADKSSFNTLLGKNRDEKKKLLKAIFDELNEQYDRFGFRGGVSALIESLTSSFAFERRTDTEITRISKQSTKWSLHSQEESFEGFDRVVLATPAYATARIVKELSTTLSEALKNIEYLPLSVVALGYDTPDNPIEACCVVSTKESLAGSLAVSLDTNIDSSYAKESGKLIRVFIGGQRDPHSALKDDQSLLDIATGSIAQITGVYEEPRLKHIVKWHKALPLFGVNHDQTVAKVLKAAQELDGLYIVSSAICGSGVENCIEEAKRYASKISGRVIV